MRLSVIRLCATALLAAASAVPQSVVLNSTPTRVVGHAQVSLVTTAANLVEGRELYQPLAVAVDTTTTPNILYVADTSNNRILAWRNSKAANGTFADKIIGQRDAFSTSSLGPGTTLSSGLYTPTGIAVDRNGNLWVVDAGNNRVLRYTKPFEQTTDLISPDFLIGQTNINSRNPNQGESAPTAKSIVTNTGSAIYNAAILFDTAGNLWFTDAGNNRVLRFPAARLSGANAPEADLVIGQTDFSTRTGPTGQTTLELRTNKNKLATPSGLAFDDNGRLYVIDSFSRILYYDGTLRTGMAASRVLGISINQPNQPARAAVNEFTLNFPEGIVTINNNLFVADTGANRIVRYDPPASWDAETELQPSPPAKAVYGQGDLLGFRANRRNPDASPDSFSGPTGMTFAGGEVFLTDTGNNRVLSIPVSGIILQSASRVQGQINFQYTSPNLVEGRELFLYSGLIGSPTFTGTGSFSAGVAIDRSGSVPHLYIADTFNNRIMCYRDARTVKPGDKADIFLGQQDGFRTQANAPNNDIDQPTDTGLLLPVGIAVDADGNVWVADSGNGRVLRFPKPFEQPEGSFQKANLVLGQTSFTFKNTDVTRNTMARPTGLTLSREGHVLVADAVHNRILLFTKSASGTFTNGQAAANVFGQPNFSTATASNAANRMNVPHHIAVDTSNRLYVADTGNSRVLIYQSGTTTATDPTPIFTVRYATREGDNLQGPQGVWVDERTGELWVADTRNNRVIRYPEFFQLSLNPISDFILGAVTPLAVTQDVAGNLYIADAANRIAIHFPTFRALSAANDLTRALTPGMIASIYPLGGSFADQAYVTPTATWPKVMGDIEVRVKDVPAPLHYVGPTQINFYIPMGTPQSGSVDVEVRRKSIDTIIASGSIQMANAAPAFFMCTQGGSTQICGYNIETNGTQTLNQPGSGVARGGVITLYGTGQGFLPSAPPDGEPAPGIVNTPVKPRVIINTRELTDAEILYSGLTPGLVGVWQLNLKVPDATPPGDRIPVAVLMYDVPSTLDATGRRITTTIAVKP